MTEGTVQFLQILGQLKETNRQGWVDNELTSVEHVSDHMYRMTVMCMMCPDQSLNKEKMIRMALCHDMAESIVGDISPKMQIPAEEKYKREEKAMSVMTSLIPELGGPQMKELWLEYEQQNTPEAQFVRDMDLLEMVIQAHTYERNRGAQLDGFYNSGKKIRHHWGKEIFERLLATRSNSNE